MTFYLLRRPDDYRSHQDDISRNGWGGCVAAMPGVECSVCGDTGGLSGRVLPWRLPPALERELVKLGRFPISEDEHKALRQRVEAGLRKIYPDAPPMPPGASFPPLYWNFKKPPKNDFFWWGHDKAVSARLAARLREMGATGFDLIPVDRVRVGVRTPRSMKAWRTGGDGTEGTPGPEIFYLSVSAVARLNSCVRQLPPCPGCGRAKIERGSNWQRWEEATWDGGDIFHFSGGGHYVVTERVAALLGELAAGDTVLTPLQEGKKAY